MIAVEIKGKPVSRMSVFGLIFILMPFLRGKYGYWILCPLLLGVYVSYFMVQLFCVIGPDHAVLLSPSVSVLSFRKSSQKENTIDQQNPIVKTGACINKRFHPSIGAFVLPAGSETPLRSYSATYILRSSGYPTVALILAESLRGPPSRISESV